MTDLDSLAHRIDLLRQAHEYAFALYLGVNDVDCWFQVYASRAAAREVVIRADLAAEIGKVYPALAGPLHRIAGCLETLGRCYRKHQRQYYVNNARQALDCFHDAHKRILADMLAIK